MIVFVKLISFFQEDRTPYIKTEFSWRIDDYQERNKFNTWECEEFYIRGYTVKMHASINVDRELLVSIQLLKGKFDDTLPWPFSYNITISLLEGKTDCPRNSKTINPSKDCDKKCFQKPGQKPNEKTGLYSLISLKKIKAKNSPIFVRFSVN